MTTKCTKYGSTEDSENMKDLNENCETKLEEIIR